MIKYFNLIFFLWGVLVYLKSQYISLCFTDYNKNGLKDLLLLKINSIIRITKAYFSQTF